MIDSIQNILVQVSDFLWSYIIITILICCAVFFTWRTRFVQFRLIREMVRLLLHPDKVQPEEIGQELSSGCGCSLCWVLLQPSSNQRLPNSISAKVRLPSMVDQPII